MGNYADLLNAQEITAKRRAPRQPAARQQPPSSAPPTSASAIQKPRPIATEPLRTVARSNERGSERPHAVANGRTGERRRARHYSFELYEDQIDRIKRLALEDQLRGGNLSQSEIVRSAIDRYLAELGTDA